MLAESVDIIVRLLESPDPIDYEGRFWSFKEMRLQLRSYQQPRMPLAIASSGNPVSVELAGNTACCFCLPPVKNRKSAEHGKRRSCGGQHGVKTSRDNWRIGTCVYLLRAGR